MSEDIDQLKARIAELEAAAKEGLRVIEWFENWLNRRPTPLVYDDSPCLRCQHLESEHRDKCGWPAFNPKFPVGPLNNTESCSCTGYRQSSYSVSYDARGVARTKLFIMKAIKAEDE